LYNWPLADLQINISNQGTSGAAFAVFDELHLNSSSPRQFAVAAHDSLADTFPTATDNASYALTLVGPNGFLRQFSGLESISSLRVALMYNVSQLCVVLDMSNQGSSTVHLAAVDNAYNASFPSKHVLNPGRFLFPYPETTIPLLMPVSYYRPARASARAGCTKRAVVRP
jgi:phospholipase C